MWKKSLVMLLQTIILIFIINADNGNTLLAENELKVPGTNKANTANSNPMDTFSIRHGRSRVRDQHMWRERRIRLNGNLTIQNINQSHMNSYDNLTNISNRGGTNESKNVVSNHRILMSSSISSENENLFGSDYWQNSDLNGTITHQEIPGIVANGMNYEYHEKSVHIPMLGTQKATVPTPTLVTHKIRKLHKKKIMESIRQRVDKSFGLRLSKNHRSLIQAEHLQGRPTDSNDISDKAQNTLDISFDDDEDENDDDDDDDDDDDNDDRNSEEQKVSYRLGNELNVNNLVVVDATSFMEDEYPNDDGELSKNVDIQRDMTTAATIVTTNLNENWHQSDEENTSIRNRITDNFPFTPEPTETTTEMVMVTKQIVTLPPKNKQDFMQHLEIPNDKRLKLTSNFMNHIQPQSNQQKTYSYESSRKTMKIENLDSHNDFEAEDKNSTLYENSYDESDYALDSTQNLLLPNESVSFEQEHNKQEEKNEEESILPETTVQSFEAESNSLEPNHLASTSVGGIGLDRQSTFEFEEISFEDRSADVDIMDGRDLDTSANRNDFMPSVNDEEDDSFETSRFLVGVVDAANEDEIYDWDEISRNNRRNLMRGRDVVTKFLQIVETQHMLGSNCEAGTSLNLGEGVVDRYAQERFRVEAEVAVNRANMLTRIFKMTSRAVQSDVNLLHASVLSMVEFDDDIFAAGNCFDWNEHPSQPGLFCPFAYRLPAPNLGAIFAKDLATEYHYLGNTSEWFFQARKNAEKVIVRNEQYLKAFHLYSNKTEERIEDDTLAVKYEDGRWSKPYYDCGGGNIWMLTYTVPFFGYENNTYHFKGTSGIDIDLRRVDIDQCPQRTTPGMTQPLNIFAGTDKCKQRTTMCEALKGLGFRRGSYKCICRKGYFFPDTFTVQKYFNGSLLEEEYEKLMLGKNSTYNIANEYECLPCAEGCDSCEDGSPCIAALNWPMRTSILVLACTVIGLLPPAAWFTFRYQQVKVVRAASPALLRVIALGAFFIYCTNIVMYPNPNLYTCTARIWMREIGFSLTYGALMLKTWRISVIFRVRSAKAVKITDAALLKRLGCICGVIGTFLLVRTLVSPPDVVVGRTADDLKAFLCKTDWWDYTFTSMEVLFLAWGVRLCIMVRKAPSEFNESRFISMAIYNEFLLTCFLNVSMLFLQSPANPDLLYIIFFCHTQLTVTLLLGLIFGSKVYIVLRSGKSHQEAIGMGAKSSGAKFNFRPQVRTFANPSSVTTSTAQVVGTNSAETKLSDQEALEEIRQLSMQLQRIQEMAPPKGVAVMTISSLLDGLKTPGGMMMVAAAASHAGNQLQLRQQQQPLLALNNEIEKYNQQLQVPQNNNIGANIVLPPSPTKPLSSTTKKAEEKSINTDISGKDLCKQILDAAQVNVICNRCLQSTRESVQNSPTNMPLTACQQLGSPHADGSLSFANIKLECMCSQSDDLDLIQHQKRRTTVRSAATNTPPTSTQVHRKYSKSKMNAPGDQPITVTVCHQICDKCKKKYNSSKYKKHKTISRIGHSGSSCSSKYKQSRLEKTHLKYATSTGSGISQTHSADILERRLSSASASKSATAAAAKKVHSIDDITFYSSSCSSRCSSTNDVSDDNSKDVSDDCDKNSNVQIHMRKITVKATSEPTKSIVECNEAAAADVVVNVDVDAIVDVPTQSVSNVSMDSNNSKGTDGLQATNTGNGSTSNENNRPKRPEKLMLDLNDRSKYSKEVSV